MLNLFITLLNNRFPAFLFRHGLLAETLSMVYTSQQARHEFMHGGGWGGAWSKMTGLLKRIIDAFDICSGKCHIDRLKKVS